MTAQPEKRWSRTDQVAVSTWAAAIIGLSIVWNQFVFQPGLPKETLLVALVVFVAGVPLALGALAGLLIRRNGPSRELFLLAGVGAACIALALYAQWVNDTRACMPTPDSPCDISLGFSAALSFALCYVPFLAGFAVGRVTSALLRRRRTTLQ